MIKERLKGKETVIAVLNSGDKKRVIKDSFIKRLLRRLKNE